MDSADFEAAVAAIRDNVMAAKGRKARVSPQHKLRASGFWPCDRYIYYSVHDWQEQPPPTAEKQCLFDEGYWMEEATLADLREAGYTIGGQQVHFKLPIRNGREITGSIDGWISGHELGDTPIPVEAKGYAFGAETHTSWRDLVDAPQPWLRAVPNQLQLYLLQADSDRGVLVMRDKKGGQLYPLSVELDYDFAEALLRRAEDIYDHLELEIPPDRISTDEYDAVCAKCPFQHICQPLQGIVVDEQQVVFDEALEAAAVAYLGTEPMAKAHKVAGDKLKAFAKGRTEKHFLIGPAELKVSRTAKRTVVKIKPQEDRDNDKHGDSTSPSS